MRWLSHSSVLAAVGSALSFSVQADVLREGSGARRSELTKMELAPFPVAAWGGLTDWTGGVAPTSESMNGKPVLIVTWAGWYPVSVNQGLKPAQDMAAKYADKGLVVVGVHHDQGWD